MITEGATTVAMHGKLMPLKVIRYRSIGYLTHSLPRVWEGSIRTGQAGIPTVQGWVRPKTFALAHDP